MPLILDLKTIDKSNTPATVLYVQRKIRTRLDLSISQCFSVRGQKDVLRLLCIPKFKNFKIVHMLCTITTLLPIPKFINP